MIPSTNHAFCSRIMFMIIVLSIFWVSNSKMSLVNQVYTQQYCNNNSLLYMVYIGKINYSMFPAIKQACILLDHSYNYISINSWCIRGLSRVCYIKICLLKEFAMTFHFYIQCMQVNTTFIIMILGILH